MISVHLHSCHSHVLYSQNAEATMAPVISGIVCLLQSYRASMEFKSQFVLQTLHFHYMLRTADSLGGEYGRHSAKIFLYWDSTPPLCSSFLFLSSLSLSTMEQSNENSKKTLIPCMAFAMREQLFIRTLRMSSSYLHCDPFTPFKED